MMGEGKVQVGCVTSCRHSVWPTRILLLPVDVFVPLRIPCTWAVRMLRVVDERVSEPLSDHRTGIDCREHGRFYVGEDYTTLNYCEGRRWTP